MPDKSSVDYASVEPGYVISSASYTFLRRNVEAYLGATDDSGDLYKEADTVPPMAVAALVMGVLSDSISFPDGAIHVSQQMEFRGAVKAGDTVKCTSTVLARRRRGNFNMITMGIEIRNKADAVVYFGKTSALLPER